MEDSNTKKIVEMLEELLKMKQSEIKAREDIKKRKKKWLWLYGLICVGFFSIPTFYLDRWVNMGLNPSVVISAGALMIASAVIAITIFSNMYRDACETF